MTGAAVLVTPGAADAAAAPGKAIIESGVLYFTAGVGVANYPTVGSLGDGRIYLDDRAPVRLEPGRADGCVQAQSNVIHCSGIREIRVYLGDGNDTFSSYHNMPSSVFGQEGNDTIYGWFGEDYLYGGLGDDQLFGLPGKDALRGEQGKDTIEGDDGPDLIVGGDGNDVLRGDRGADRIEGEAGRDMVYGGPDDDILNGGNGNGSGTGLRTDSGHVYGEHGNDQLVYDLSSTTYYGGEGIDTIDYSRSPWPMRVSLFDNSYDMWLPEPDDAVPWSHDAHSDIEHLIGTEFNDELTGNRGDNTISGRGGNDKIWGSDGDDILDADLGANQRIVGGIGVDICVGAGVTYRESCEN
jgi:Ca2+-binding RTX toxin-like protein